MTKHYRQGDILLKKIEDGSISGMSEVPRVDDRVVVAEGEVTGHAHVFTASNVAMFREDGVGGGLAGMSGVPAFLKIGDGGADLSHEEHDTIHVESGDYEIVQQREFDGKQARAVSD